MTDERKVIIQLEAVYDNSDIMTDYFARDTPYFRWFVMDYPGKVVAEPKLRAALKHLPDWLQGFNWTYQKGEKYSMSDHPYGQLRVDGQSGVYVKSHGGVGRGDRQVSFLLSTSTEYGFLMNDSKDVKVPESREEFVDLVNAKEAEKLPPRVAPPPKPKSEEELLAIWNSLNESEKFGVAFGMFPVRLKDLTKDECVSLMRIRERLGPRMVFDEAVERSRNPPSP